MPTELDKRLEALRAPPAGLDFHQGLWERIAAKERTSRRRRRITATVAIAAALVTASAAGVFAFGEQTPPLDQTLTCPLPEQGGVNVLNLVVHVKAPPIAYGGKPVPNPAVALVTAGPLGSSQEQYAGVSSLRGGYWFDQSVCRTARSIPLSRSALSSAGVFKGAEGAGIQRECWLAPTFTVRLRVTLGASSTPVAARLAIRSGAKLRPVAYIEWSPTLVRAFVSSSCRVR